MHKTFGKCTQTTDWNYKLVSLLYLIRLLYKVCQYLGPGIGSRVVTLLASHQYKPREPLCSLLVIPATVS